MYHSFLYRPAPLVTSLSTRECFYSLIPRGHRRPSTGTLKYYTKCDPLDKKIGGPETRIQIPEVRCYGDLVNISKHNGKQRQYQVHSTELTDLVSSQSSLSISQLYKKSVPRSSCSSGARSSTCLRPLSSKTGIAGIPLSLR